MQCIDAVPVAFFSSRFTWGLKYQSWYENILASLEALKTWLIYTQVILCNKNYNCSWFQIFSFSGFAPWRIESGAPDLHTFCAGVRGVCLPTNRDLGEIEQNPEWSSGQLQRSECSHESRSFRRCNATCVSQGCLAFSSTCENFFDQTCHLGRPSMNNRSLIIYGSWVAMLSIIPWSRHGIHESGMIMDDFPFTET